MNVRRTVMQCALGLAGPWAAGCTPTADSPEELGPARGREADTQESPDLVHAQSCDDVQADLEAVLIADMEARLDANLEQALTFNKYGCLYDLYEADSGGLQPNGGGGPDKSGASEYSETNVQVEGVDEADFVKNDGGYVYALADGHFQVLDAWPAAATHRLSSFKLEGEPRRMYVHADTAVIYSSLGPIGEPTPGFGPFGGFYDHYDDVPCTYGYDCEFTGDGRELKITVLDIADRAHPRLEREVYFDGAYLNSRRIGPVVHTAVVSPEISLPGLSYWPEEVEEAMKKCFSGELTALGFTDAELAALFEQLRQSNLAVIAGAPATALLPTIRDTLYLDGAPYTSEGPLAACEDTYMPATGAGRSFVSLVSFAIDESAPPSAVNVLSRPGAVYASADSLYLAVRHDASTPWVKSLGEAAEEGTAVHKFALAQGGAAPEYAASGAARGRLLNQFAMDEHAGALRIATTSGHLPSPDVHSAVSVLVEQGSRLKQVGQVDGLAPGEDIRSVRFDGPVGFVVTFKKTDPLFVLDLSDPQAPHVAGELKIPGFSTYMHLMDDAHLLTIGYDADDQGEFAWFQGVQLQVIDVSDLSQPKLLHKEVIGTRGSTSDAATDHLAFTYFKARDLLAVPMTVCEGGDGGMFGDLMTFSGLMVYRVTAEDGFKLLGGVPHLPPETPQVWSDQCSSWWTRPNSIVKRSAFLEDWVFSIAPELVKVAHLDDLAHPAASVSLQVP
jgi:hypothetical protein